MFSDGLRQPLLKGHSTRTTVATNRLRTAVLRCGKGSLLILWKKKNLTMYLFFKMWVYFVHVKVLQLWFCCSCYFPTIWQQMWPMIETVTKTSRPQHYYICMWDCILAVLEDLNYQYIYHGTSNACWRDYKIDRLIKLSMGPKM